MGQVTINLDNQIENKLKGSKKSVSKWVAAVIKEKVSTEWPQNISALAGSWKIDFPSLEKIRAARGLDTKREDF